MAHHGVVLLCAEDDDLELVSWVHAARKHGITPEVVTGVEHDDEPFIAALSDAGSRLFVALRSENLPLARVHELKAVFARHRQHGQQLLALKLQPEEAEDAIVKIAAKIGRDVRPRSGAFPVVGLSERSGTLGLSEKSGTFGLSEKSGALGLSEKSGTLGLSEASGTMSVVDRTGATPLPVLEESTPISSGTEPTGVFALSTVTEAAAPPVTEALDWARRATELEVTESLPRIDPRPPSTMRDDPPRSRRRRSVGTIVGTVAGVLTLCGLVGGVLWLAAGEWTSPVDGAQRSSVVAPADGSRTDADEAPSEARIPSMPRSENGESTEPSKRRARPRPRATAPEAELAPLETVDAPAEAVAAPLVLTPSKGASPDAAKPSTADTPSPSAEPSEPTPAEPTTTVAAEPTPRAPTTDAPTVAAAPPPA